MTVHNTILVIFGITGDLSKRKLLPALTHMSREGHLEGTRIVGISRRNVTVDEVLGNDTAIQDLKPLLHMITMDVSRDEDYRILRDTTEKLQHETGENTQVIIYLSVPPHASQPIVESLGKAGMNGPDIKVLLEKPFGTDLSSAAEANALMRTYFKEDQLYRIDHYLAKEMTQNIVAFRTHNAIFRNLWSSKFIEKIDIIASEKIGIENRAEFYEQTGALRDVVQNHLMQLAALTLMDLSDTFAAKDIPQLRLNALNSIDMIRPDTFYDRVFRAQYKGYDTEVENPGSMTETFAAITLFSNDPNWQGVPIRLATGKNMEQQTTEIRVSFKQSHAAESNLLVLHIQPKEGIEIDLMAKRPGYEKEYEKVSLTFDYREQAGRPVEAYERVLVDAIVSDKSLFTTADEVMASWRILQPVQERWGFHTDDLATYEPGSSIESILDASA